MAYHFIAGPGSLTLELCKLSAVVDGDKQLPDSQERHPYQKDTANHGQEDGHGIGSRSTLCRGPGGTISKGTSISIPLPSPTSSVSKMKGTCLAQSSSHYSLLGPPTALGRLAGQAGILSAHEVKGSKRDRDSSSECMQSLDENLAGCPTSSHVPHTWLHLLNSRPPQPLGLLQPGPVPSVGCWTVPQLLCKWFQEQTGQAGGLMKPLLAGLS